MRQAEWSRQSKGDDNFRAGTASAYQTRFRDRTSVRKAVLAMHEIILPRRLSLAGCHFCSEQPSGQILALHVLHFPEQLRSAEALPPMSRPAAASPEEQQLAGVLIDAATKPIPWSDYRDDTAEQLRTLIQAKLEGRTLAAPVTEEIPILQLVDALKRSVAQALQQPGAGNKGCATNESPAADAVPGQGKKKAPRKAPSRRSA